MKYDERTIVGLIEEIEVKQPEKNHKVMARIDSGAIRSSMDVSLASELTLGPVVASKMIKSANGVSMRPVVEATVIIEGNELTDTFTLADRSHMRYKVLIGQNILKRGFLIDPNK